MINNEKLIELQSEIILKEFAALLDTKSIVELDFSFQELSLRLSYLMKLKLESLTKISISDKLLKELKERRTILDNV